MKSRDKLVLTICLVLITIYILLYQENNKNNVSLSYAKSIMYSPESSTLGTILSDFATLYGLEKDQNIICYMTKQQSEVIYKYFKEESLKSHLKILENYHPDYVDYPWIDPFQR